MAGSVSSILCIPLGFTPGRVACWQLLILIIIQETHPGCSREPSFHGNDLSYHSYVVCAQQIRGGENRSRAQGYHWIPELPSPKSSLGLYKNLITISTNLLGDNPSYWPKRWYTSKMNVLASSSNKIFTQLFFLLNSIMVYLIVP